jgi:hypothetical protein
MVVRLTRVRVGVGSSLRCFFLSTLHKVEINPSTSEKPRTHNMKETETTHRHRNRGFLFLHWFLSSLQSPVSGMHVLFLFLNFSLVIANCHLRTASISVLNILEFYAVDPLWITFIFPVHVALA